MAPDSQAMAADAHVLALAGSTEELVALLDSCAVDASAIKQSGMYHGWTLLHCAAARGHAELVRELLRRGADTTARNRSGKCSWELANARGHIALAATLETAAVAVDAPAKPRAALPQPTPQPPALRTRSAASATVRETLPIGELLHMCSEAEARERQRCKELSPLEVVAPLADSNIASASPVDLRRTVKRYVRPGAGAPVPPASELRPIEVLQKTVDYLTNLWLTDETVTRLYRYHFVADRLRAVQQVRGFRVWGFA